jgi:hypothetical protein
MVENEKLQMGLWSMTDKGKTYVKETCNLSQHHFVHHKCHIVKNGAKPGL